MELIDVFRRDNPPQPWSEGETIPWHDPGFSQRILKEHLSQKHDAASRRTSLVDKQVKWIHGRVLDGRSSRILDLGCGPGLYTSRLSKLGHVSFGIDVSPAAIAYAREHAPAACSYTLGDIRTAEYGSGFDLVMLIFDVLNVIKPEDARLVLKKAHEALKVGGTLLLEVSTFDAVYERGNQPASWYRAENEFFADAPHLCLMEPFWDEELAIAMERYYIVDVASKGVVCYVNSTQAYTDQQYQTLIHDANFDEVQVQPSLTGRTTRMQQELYVLLARKKE